MTLGFGVPLLGAWTKSDVRVWSCAVNMLHYLGQIGHLGGIRPEATAAAPALIEALKDDDVHVRSAAA